MSQLVGMASGEYTHHLVTIWPLTQPGPTVPSPTPPPPHTHAHTHSPIPYCYAPISMSKDPLKKKLWFLGGLWE